MREKELEIIKGKAISLLANKDVQLSEDILPSAVRSMQENIESVAKASNICISHQAPFDQAYIRKMIELDDHSLTDKDSLDSEKEDDDVEYEKPGQVFNPSITPPNVQLRTQPPSDIESSWYSASIPTITYDLLDDRSDLHTALNKCKFQSSDSKQDAQNKLDMIKVL